MDWEHIKQHGYSAWQVIPLFFTTYIAMALIFGACAQIAWQNYYQLPEHRAGGTHAVHFQRWTEAMALLVSGATLLSVAIAYCIIACLVVLVLRKKQRIQHTPAPEPEAATSVDRVVDNWYPSTSEIGAQEYMERYCILSSTTSFDSNVSIIEYNRRLS